jgi:hypothetical protein
MPPIPPPDTAGASFFFGASATMASVVIITPATEAPARPSPVNNAGAQHVDILLGLRVEAIGLGLVLVNLANHHQPSTPAFSTIWWTGSSSALNTMLISAWMSGLSSLSLPTRPWRAAAPHRRPQRFALLMFGRAPHLFVGTPGPTFWSIVEVNVE